MLEIIIAFGWFVSIVFGQEYFVDKRLNCNNVWGSVSNGTSTEYIKFLGLFNTTQECIDACVLNSTNELRCETYTYHTSQFDGESFRLNCFGRFGYPLWTPVEQDNINCGRIIWNCQSDMDCSLNGKCQSNGNCTCRTGWSGYKCDTLNLLDGVRNTGYNITESDGNRTSRYIYVIYVAIYNILIKYIQSVNILIVFISYLIIVGVQLYWLMLMIPMMIQNIICIWLNLITIVVLIHGH